MGARLLISRVTVKHVLFVCWVFFFRGWGCLCCTFYHRLQLHSPTNWRKNSCWLAVSLMGPSAQGTRLWRVLWTNECKTKESTVNKNSVLRVRWLIFNCMPTMFVCVHVWSLMSFRFTQIVCCVHAVQLNILNMHLYTVVPNFFIICNKFD